MDHNTARISLGSYLAGALDPAERTEIQAHLTTCPACREELASFAGLPGLMTRLSPAEVQTRALRPPPSLLPKVLAAIDKQRAIEATRLRRWRSTAVGGVLLAAAASLAAVVALAPADHPTGPPAVSRPLLSTAGTAAAGTASLESRPWGTQIHLIVHDLPAEGTFTAWALDGQGHSIIAASWHATPNGRADVTGAAALPAKAVAAVRVTTSNGKPILTTAG